MDRTASFWARALGCAQAKGMTEVGLGEAGCRWLGLPSQLLPLLLQAQVTKLKGAQLLRSFAARTDFTEAAVQVVRHLPQQPRPRCLHRPPCMRACGAQARLVSTTSDYFQQHRGSYVQPGKLSEADRDQVEAQLGSHIKQCKDSIARLQASVPGGADPAAASQAAYQLGVVRPWLPVCSRACMRGADSRWAGAGALRAAADPGRAVRQGQVEAVRAWSCR